MIVARMWKTLMGYLDKITDETLKKSMLGYYRCRAIQEWGYCPDGTEAPVPKEEIPEYLEDLVKKIKTAKEYGVFVKDTKVELEVINRMSEYIESGGGYSNLPDYLKTKHIQDIYFTVLFNKIDECIRFLENT